MDFYSFYENTLQWIISHYIEILGTISGLLYLVFSIKGNILLWPFGIVTSALYIYVFFVSRLYADMSINIYYVLISIYGWYHWLHPDKGSASGNEKLRITRITRRIALILTIITAALFVLIAFILIRYTDSDIPLWDAFTTALSITATWMLARKILEHWILWIVVDSVSAGLYVYKELYPTLILFLVYTTLAVVGFYQWKKEWIKMNSE